MNLQRQLKAVKPGTLRVRRDRAYKWGQKLPRRRKVVVPFKRDAYPTWPLYRRAYKNYHQNACRALARLERLKNRAAEIQKKFSTRHASEKGEGLAPIDIKRHDPRKIMTQEVARLLAMDQGNTRYLRTYEPVIVEQLVRALRDNGLPTNDVVSSGKMRRRARRCAELNNGRLTCAQVAQIVQVVKAEKPISYLNRAVKVALQFAQSGWGNGRAQASAVPLPHHARPTYKPKRAQLADATPRRTRTG